MVTISEVRETGSPKFSYPVQYRDVKIEVGTLIYPDGWRFGYRLENETWARADFRLPTGYDVGITSLSVRITLTGRTIQRKLGHYVVRCKIEFVGDGEPSTFHNGYVVIE